MSPAWTAVRVRNSGNRAALIAALFEIGAEGVEEREDELVTHLRDADQAAVTRTLAKVDAMAAVEYSAAPEVDWSSAWRSGIGAHRIGRLVICPPWLADRYLETERVVIDPGMAFGTGEHETTRGLIRLLSRSLTAGDRVADLGAGSAVLSIAAAKLGASRAIAIELDPYAIDNANANVERNNVAGIVSVLEGDAGLLLPLVAPVRVVVANIISSVLLDLMPAIDRALAPGGVAILGGILVDEKQAFVNAISQRGWRILETEEEGLWWSVTTGR